MTARQKPTSKKIMVGDNNHKFIMNLVKNGHIRLDKCGEVGRNTSAKTNQFIAKAGENYALSAAAHILSNPRTYYGRVERHDNPKKGIVIIYDGDATLYVKAIVVNGWLVVGIHPHTSF